MNLYLLHINESKINATDKLTVTKPNKLKTLNFDFYDGYTYGSFSLSFHLDHTHTHTHIHVPVQPLSNISEYLNVVKLTKKQLMCNDRCSIVASVRSECEINIHNDW